MSVSKNQFRSFTMSDFSESMKKFGSASSTFFNRAKQVGKTWKKLLKLSYVFYAEMMTLLQYTEEQLGKSEATVLDARFMSLNEKADRTKCRTEQLLKQTETLLQPNIGKSTKQGILKTLNSIDSC